MLLILSPAKIQNIKATPIIGDFTLPVFMKEARQLVKEMQQLSLAELKNLLDVNTQISELNHNRFFNWNPPFTPENAKQAALMFDGEVFRGLQAQSFSIADMQYAQHHLYILSGLYGALRPCDLIQPYRLEISSALQNKAGKDLYPFWRPKISKLIASSLREIDSNIIVNLASSEYFKALDINTKKVRVIDVEFLEYKNDNFKPIVIYIKKARGLMARFLIQNRINTVEEIKGFNVAGYWFSPQQSTENKLVFIR